MHNKSILAFDCAGSGASISLQSGGKTTTASLPQGNQAAQLVSKIDQLMHESGLNYADLTTIITTIGPGSFTGLRIGLAALHGLVLVHRTPIKTITTLETLAWQTAKRADSPARYLTALRAGKGEVYVQEFIQTEGQPIATGEIYLAPETQTEWPLPLFSTHLPADAPNHLPALDTELLCTIADQLPEANLANALPLYIRPPDAIIPKQAAWLSN